MKTLFITISSLADLMKDDYTRGLVERIRRPDPDKRALIQAMDSGNKSLMEIAAKSLHASKTMLRKALTCEFLSVKEYAAINPNCDETLLAMAINDEDEPVVIAALRNTKITKELVTKVLEGNYSEAIKFEAIKSGKANSKQMLDALHGKSLRLRQAAQIALNGRVHKAERQ